MAGHMGSRKVTTQNLEVVSTNEETGVILVRGAVPGAKGGWVTISDAVKKQLTRMRLHLCQGSLKEIIKKMEQNHIKRNYSASVTETLKLKG